MENMESGNGNGTRIRELKTGDFLRVLLTIAVLVRLFILICCNNKVSKCKLKKDLFGNKTKEFRYSMTITNSPLVA